MHFVNFTEFVQVYTILGISVKNYILKYIIVFTKLLIAFSRSCYHVLLETVQ